MTRGVLGVLLAAAIVTGIVLGGWQAGWWFAGQNAARDAHLVRNGYSNQQTLREQITNKIADAQAIGTQITEVSGDAAETAALKAQQKALVNIVCQDADQVTGDPLPTDQAAYVADHCSAGSAK
jgi:hypothetical protein